MIYYDYDYDDYISKMGSIDEAGPTEHQKEPHSDELQTQPNFAYRTNSTSAASGNFASSGDGR